MSMKAAYLFDLKGRVALVTGASGGLGLRFAEVLAANGAAVALVARRADKLKAAREKIEKAGGKAIAIEADVLDRAAMNRAFDQAEKLLGTVTILVNNAGVAHSTRGTEVLVAASANSTCATPSGVASPRRADNFFSNAAFGARISNVESSAYSCARARSISSTSAVRSR